jgi:tRNA G18 (ribose-2'-O)-methylase SpoU
MGGAFRLPCVAIEEAAFRAWSEKLGLRVLLAEPGRGIPRPRPTAPIALVVGNEGAGIRPSLSSWAYGTIGIPLRPGAESLNVAVAAGILLYEVTRE